MKLSNSATITLVHNYYRAVTVIIMMRLEIGAVLGSKMARLGGTESEPSELGAAKILTIQINF